MPDDPAEMAKQLHTSMVSKPTHLAAIGSTGSRKTPTAAKSSQAGRLQVVNEDLGSSDASVDL